MQGGTIENALNLQLEIPISCIMKVNIFW